MAIMRDMSKSQITFQVADRDIDEFEVIRYRGSEGLCQLYRFELELASEHASVDFDNIVGKPAALSIASYHGVKWFHGAVARFEVSGARIGASRDEDKLTFRAELVPNLWFLTHRYTSRIFQGKTVPEIITQVLTDAGILSDRFDMSGLSETYDPREYCVQYRETDYNFICRLMEAEGIWWYFEQAPDKHVLKLADSSNAYAAIPDPVQLPFVPPRGMNVTDEHVYRFRLGRAVRPGKVVLNDYNFETPATNLESLSTNGLREDLEFSDYPGEYATQGDGQHLAELRGQEFKVGHIRGVGQSNSIRLSPSKTFELIEHPSESLNASYVITSITYQGKQAIAETSTGSSGRTSVLGARVHQSLIAARTHELPAIRELAEGLLQVASRLGIGDPTARRELTEWLYHGGQVMSDLAGIAGSNGSRSLEWVSIPNLIEDVARTSLVDYDAPVYEARFECLPADVEFRPPRVTPWPEVRGPQSARVVGPDSEEIHVDQYGRVRVQFDWDRLGNEGGEPKLHGADSSCWIRVSQGFAGGAYGMWFIPRVGQEVIVDFLEGNPDRPVITGRLYNQDHMPPYPLPDEKTKSVIKTNSSIGGGGNHEIRFEDLKDNEQLLIQAQRRMDTRVKGGHYHTTGAYHLVVGGEYEGELKGELRELVHKAKHVHIKGDLFTWVELCEHRVVQEDQAIEVQGVHSTHVCGDVGEVYDSNHKTEVTATYHCKAMSIKLEADSGIEIKCGGSSICLTPAAIFITAPIVNINSGSGPPVSPVTLSGMSPGQAEDASGADSTDPGHDTRYTATREAPEIGEMGPEIAHHEFAGTYVEFQLVDAAERPVADEQFRVTLPDESIQEGTTDAEGLCRFEGLDVGLAFIQLPNRPDSSWRKIRVEWPT